MLVSFGALSIGIAVLDLLIAWNTGTRLSGTILGVGVVAYSLPLIAIIAFATLAFMSITVPLAVYRANGTLRQLATTPVSWSTFIIAHLPIRLVLGLAQIVVLLALAVLFAGPTSAALVRTLVLLISGLLFFLSVGYLIGARSVDPDRAMGFAYMLIITLIATSGTALPLDVLPDAISVILRWLPTTLFAQNLSSEFLSTQPALLPFGTTVLLLLVAALALFVLSSRSFRWESRRT